MCNVCVDYWFNNIDIKQFKDAILDTPAQDEHTKEVLEFIENNELEKI